MTDLYNNLRQQNLKEINKHKSFSFITQNQVNDLIKEQKQQQSEKEKNILNKHIDNINKITQKSKKRI